VLTGLWYTQANKACLPVGMVPQGEWVWSLLSVGLDAELSLGEQLYRHPTIMVILTTFLGPMLLKPSAI